jgi:hypothetical protein
MSIFHHNFHCEQVLKQNILKDLITDDLGRMYKRHTEQTVAWVKNFAQEVQLNNSQQKILLAAAYSYDWGCANLKNGLKTKHDNPAEHLSSCFKLAGSKMERLLTYRCGRDFNQTELLQVVDIIEDQASPSTYLKDANHTQLSQLLLEASLLSWLQLGKRGDHNLDYQQLKRQVKKLTHQFVRAEAALIIAEG